MVASDPPDLAVVGDPDAVSSLGEVPVVLLDGDTDAAAAEVRRRFPPPRELALSGAVVDLAERTVRRPDGEQTLSPTETRLLRFMSAHPGQELPEQELSRRCGAIGRRSDRARS